MGSSTPRVVTRTGTRLPRAAPVRARPPATPSSMTHPTDGADLRSWHARGAAARPLTRRRALRDRPPPGDQSGYLHHERLPHAVRRIARFVVAIRPAPGSRRHVMQHATTTRAASRDDSTTDTLQAPLASRPSRSAGHRGGGQSFGATRNFAMTGPD